MDLKEIEETNKLIVEYNQRKSFISKLTNNPNQLGFTIKKADKLLEESDKQVIVSMLVEIQEDRMELIFEKLREHGIQL